MGPTPVAWICRVLDPDFRIFISPERDSILESLSDYWPLITDYFS